MSEQSIIKFNKRLEGMDLSSSRAKVLLAVRDFRASWLNLGMWLTEIAFGGDYKEFGYEEFEIYCARELGLKKPTVQKLMVSYNYMKANEPKLLEASEEKYIPSYTVINELNKARNSEIANQEEIDRMHDRAFSGEITGIDARKEIKAACKKPDLFDGKGQTSDKIQIIELLKKKCKEVRQVLRHDTGGMIPDGFKERLWEILVEADKLES